MAGSYRTEKEKKIRAILSVIAVAVALVIYLYNWYMKENMTAEGKFSYHFIDVGQGDCTLILSEEKAVLVDSGTGEYGQRTVEYISQYVDTIDYMILTHPHEDHIGGADDILEALTVKTVVMPDATSESVAFSKLLDAIEKENCEVEQGMGGLSYQCGDIFIELFSPVSEVYNDTNNYSIVSKVTAGGVSLMLSGDAEAYVEEQILDNYLPYELDCDIMKSGHHGSSTSNSEDFMKAVSPEISVISCGEGNSYGHPHREHIKMLQDMDIEYYRTDRDGTVICVIENGEVSVFCTSGGDYQLSLQ